MPDGCYTRDRRFRAASELEAHEPPEARGLRRGEAAHGVEPETGSIRARTLRRSVRWLSAGDLLVVNTSATVNASLPARTAHGRSFELHLSTRLPGGLWSVELRQPGEKGSLPYDGARAGMVLLLPANGRVTLLAPYPFAGTLASTSRLWAAAVDLPEAAATYLERHGRPIRYSYVPRSWPIQMYQTVFANEPGSAEMPSAGRPFTPELVTRLVSRGVEIAPLVLHTGVASLESHEPPYDEYTACRDIPPRASMPRSGQVDSDRGGNHRGSPLETVTDDRGTTSPGEMDRSRDRWRPVATFGDRVDHRPARVARHAFDASRTRRGSGVGGGVSGASTSCAHAEARCLGYPWHEFGDSHLIVASRDRRTPTVR